LKVNLIVDGEKINLNDFANDVLGGTLKGAISPLRGVDSNWKKLELTVER